jgi:altronate dehydratase large subunit
MREDIFFGYERSDGVGVRNHVLILPTVVCSAKTATEIACTVKEARVATHPFGCAQAGEDLETTYRTLRNTGRNPNVASLLLVSLGCEKISADKLADDISNAGKRVEVVTIQDGGTPTTLKKGIRIAKELVRDATKQVRVEFNVSDLVVGLNCGGSDWTSGVSANPAVGYAMDMIVDRRGRIILSETPEIIGAEHILSRRATDRKVGRKLLATVKIIENRCRRIGVPARGTNLSLGNVAGGITTLEEKSLGAIQKAGTKPLVDVVQYGEKVPKKGGLYFMDAPGHDVEAVSGIVAGGSQIVVFTTGRGTPVGNPIAPVIKITGNLQTYRRMKDNMDINAGTIIEGKETLKNIGKKIYQKILSVASGEKTRSEILGHQEFGIFKPYPSF